MKKTIFYFAILFLVQLQIFSQTDTLEFDIEFDLPEVLPTSGLNLACDGNYLWLSEHMSDKIYKIDFEGNCLDTINSIKTTSSVFIGDDLWLAHDYSNYLFKINKNDGQVIDSVKLDLLDKLGTGTNKCRDMCYMDSVIYSIWPYGWGGVYRFFKTDLSTNETIDLGDIPTYNNILAFNDTIWAGASELYPIYSGGEMISLNRSLFFKDIHIGGIEFDKGNLWVIDFNDKKLNKIDIKYIGTNLYEELRKDWVKIFPNPSSDYVYINIDNVIIDCIIELYDLNGRIILSKGLNKGQGELDLIDVKAGQYFLILKSENINICKKIIKY